MILNWFTLEIKKNATVCLGFILLISSFHSQAQNAFKVLLNSKVEDDKLKKTQAIIPVYKFTSLSIEPYSTFGISDTKNGKNINIKKMPVMEGCTDTAYSFIYFSGIDNTENHGYILAIIGNYNRMFRYTTHFYIDKNNNLDFTDDGLPYLMPFKNDTIVVNLKNAKWPESDYEVKFSRLLFGKNLAYKDLLNEHYKKHSGQKTFTKINNCFREQRYNLCSANFKSPTDSFTIGIKDMNVNALYNDFGTDMIYVGAYKQPIISEDLIEYKKGKTTFEWNEKLFTIITIDPLGKWIELKEIKRAQITKRLKLYRKVPKLDFANEMSEKHSLKTYRKKHIYLYFFNDDLACLTEDTLYLRKLHDDFGHSIEIIGMNYGDEPRAMRFFKQYYHIPWIIGMSNREINKAFFVENLPKGYWIGKHRRLKGRNYTPLMMYEKANIKFKKKNINP